MELMNLNHPASHKCWEYDPLAENQCLVRNMKTRGVQSCNQFVCKI